LQLTAAGQSGKIQQDARGLVHTACVH